MRGGIEDHLRVGWGGHLSFTFRTARCGLYSRGKNTATINELLGPPEMEFGALCRVDPARRVTSNSMVQRSASTFAGF